MVFIATIVTGKQTVLDFQTLLVSLDTFTDPKKPAELFVLTDSATAPLLHKLKSRTVVHIRESLNEYTGMDRKMMEARPGNRYGTLWHHFMIEKAAAMEWVFADRHEAATEGVWFLDADIALLGALPAVPAEARLALSPHYIRAGDERLYGKYNGGFLWTRDPSLLAVWRRATYGSRFFEQSALEEVAKAAAEAEALHEFPIQVNFGWWRLVQSADPPAEIQGRFGYHRTAGTAGITYDGQSLLSVHTHFYAPATDKATHSFNELIVKHLTLLARSHKEAKAMLTQVQKVASNKLSK